MDAAVAALLGAAVGAAGSFGATWLQMRNQYKREMMRMAVDIAIHSHTIAQGLAEKAGYGTVIPPAGYFIFHQRLLQEAEKGPITKSVLDKINNEFTEIMQAMREESERENQRRAAPPA